jgi:cob(I)alamin adenosyltransferase
MSFLSTKAGDTGCTKMGTTEFAKYDPEIIAMSQLDLLQARAGECIYKCEKLQIAKEVLSDLDNELYIIMGLFYMSLKDNKVEIDLQSQIAKLDNYLANCQLQPISNFILPIKTEIGVALNNFRADIRFAETQIAQLGGFADLKKYINRLSDCIYAYSLSSNLLRRLSDVSVEFASL